MKSDLMTLKEALAIASNMVEIPYDDLMHTSQHKDIVERMFNLAKEIQDKYHDTNT